MARIRYLLFLLLLASVPVSAAADHDVVIMDDNRWLVGSYSEEDGTVTLSDGKVISTPKDHIKKIISHQELTQPRHADGPPQDTPTTTTHVPTEFKTPSPPLATPPMTLNTPVPRNDPVISVPVAEKKTHPEILPTQVLPVSPNTDTADEGQRLKAAFEAFDAKVAKTGKKTDDRGSQSPPPLPLPESPSTHTSELNPGVYFVLVTIVIILICYCAKFIIFISSRNVSRHIGSKSTHNKKSTFSPSQIIRTSALKASRQWLSRDEIVNVHSYVIKGGLFYYVDGGKDEYPYNPSTIVRGFAVNAPVSGALGYWPSYYYLEPGQRGAYLSWLRNGRGDPIDIGYVFLYFYGLEWRAFKDRHDSRLIAEELVRLHGIYGDNKVFHQYCTGALGALILSSDDIGGVIATTDWLRTRSRLHHGANPLLIEAAIRTYLGTYLPHTWTMEAVRRAARFRKSVVYDRMSLEVEALFLRRLEEKWPSGLPLPSASSRDTYPYHWGIRNPPVLGFSLPLTGYYLTPNKSPLALHDIWLPVDELWEACLKELMPQSRKKAATSKVATSSPAALARPEMAVSRVSTLQGWFEQSCGERGLVYISFKDLAAKVDQSVPKTVTGRQLATILAHFDEAGLAIEPDLRPSSKGVFANDGCIVFNPVEDFSTPSLLCRSMRYLVEAAIAIAVSDGEMSDEEWDGIIDHLDKNSRLTPLERKRLGLYGRYLIDNGKIDLDFNNLHTAAITQPQKLAVVALAVEIALKDNVVTQSEREALVRLYAALDLPLGGLERLLHTGTGAKADVTIDWAAVDKMQAETNQVQLMLAEALTEDDDHDHKKEELTAASPPPLPPPTSPVHTADAVPVLMDGRPSPPARIADIVRAINGISTVGEDEFKAICRNSHLMPSAAIDLINEWSEEHLGDRLIDGDGPYSVNNSLLKACA